MRRRREILRFLLRNSALVIHIYNSSCNLGLFKRFRSSAPGLDGGRSRAPSWDGEMNSSST